MQDVAFWFGAGMMVIGGLMLVYARVDHGANEIEALGVKFKLSHPSLVIIVLGFALLVMNDSAVAPDNPHKTEPPPVATTSGQGGSAAPEPAAPPANAPDPVPNATQAPAETIPATTPTGPANTAVTNAALAAKAEVPGAAAANAKIDAASRVQTPRQ